MPYFNWEIPTLTDENPHSSTGGGRLLEKNVLDLTMCCCFVLLVDYQRHTDDCGGGDAAGNTDDGGARDGDCGSAIDI